MEESIEDYQLLQVTDYDYLAIADIINKKADINQYQDIKKSYVHSLFTPVLSYIIGYLNNNKEDKGTIGKSEIDEIEVIYIVLNHKIYDLFFARDKGNIYNEKNEIDFNIEKENYYLSPIQVEKELDSDKLNQIALSFYGETNHIGDLKELFRFKKKEILSKFKLGYSIQERIINTLISKANNQIIELPNLIFYKKNDRKKIFSEIDRVITVNKFTDVDKFLIYSKAEFRISKNIEYKNIKEGIKLSLEKDSCSFIEIKTSMNRLLPKENDEKKKNYNNNDYFSVTSSINSGDTDKKNIFTKMYYNMEAFINLFTNLSIKYNKINLIIIIDSYFPKDFFTNAEIFAKSLDKNIKIKFDFDLYFIQVESDMIYANELIKNREKDQEIKDLKKNSIEKEKKINQINDKMAALHKLQKDSEQKYNKLKKELEEKIKSFELKLLNSDREKKIIKIKKKIQRDNNLLETIKKEANNWIECKMKNKIETIDKKKNFDFKTFCRLYYKEENLDFIDTIKRKHLKNLDKYINTNKYIEIKNLILIVDFVFILSLKEIMGKYFKNKNVIIDGFANNFFKITFHEPKELNKISFAMKIDYPGLPIVNLKEVPDMNNFISYYFEIKKIKNGNKDNIKFFPLYNPITNRNDCYLEIQKTNCKKFISKAVFLLVDPNYEIEELKLENYETTFKYIVILYKIYLFENPDKNSEKKYFDKLFEMIFPNEKSDYQIIYITNNIFGIEDIVETNSKKLSKVKSKNSDKTLLIINTNKNTIESKFRVIDSSSNYMINTNIIIDKNIKCIMESISLSKNRKIKVLIDQSCNVLYKYLKDYYKSGKFILLNNILDNNINDLKKKITTYEENELNFDIISYITKNDKEKFDLIISEYSFSNNANLFNNEDALICIKNNLNEKGRFIIHLFFDNIYEINHIKDYLHSAFKKVEILNKSYDHRLDNVLSCSNV